MRNRTCNRLYAKINGYFWLPCPICGQEFGGHEWKDRKGLSSGIRDPHRQGVGIGICPDCTLEGHGEDWWERPERWVQDTLF